LAFKPHKGICVCHGKENIIVVKAGYCARGNYELKQNKKKAEGKETKKKTYVKKPTGELAMFRAIWETRPHKCTVCKSGIKEATPSNFAHILSKGSYPSLRLLDRNIEILCADCHYKFDFGDSSGEEFKALKEKRELLKQEYYAASR